MTIDLRRTTSGTFTVMALALVLLVACETNENRMDATELTVFATRYAAAWSGQDPAAFALFYAESGSFAINDGEPAVGRDAIEEVAQGFMNAFPDMLVTLVEVRQQKRAGVFLLALDRDEYWLRRIRKRGGPERA